VLFLGTSETLGKKTIAIKNVGCSHENKKKQSGVKKKRKTNKKGACPLLLFKKKIRFVLIFFYI